MSTYKIDTNISIPRIRRPRAVWQELIEQMQIGHSVWVKTKNEKMALINALKAERYLPVTRKEGEGFRVWKCEPFKKVKVVE